MIDDEGGLRIPIWIWYGGFIFTGQWWGPMVIELLL